MKSQEINSRVLPGPDLLPELLDAMPHACVFVRDDGVIHLANRAFGDFFGMTPADLVGQTLKDIEREWLKTFSEPLAYHETVTHPFEDREADFSRDAEVATPQRRILEFKSTPVRREGVFIGRFWVIRDITDEREITDLKIRYGGQRNADELKSKFMTVVSHQLRTPMNVMRWNLDVLLSGDAGDLPQEASDLLRDIYKSLIVSLSIIDDMLLAVDIEQQAFRLEKVSIDVSAIIEKVVRDFSRSVSLRKQTLNFEPPKNLTPLFLDPARMEKVFVRLLDNAVKYTPDGGKISIEIHSTKDAIEIDFRDSGIGMTPADRERLFERFYRSKRAIEMNPNASGLGLFIAKFIVAAHAGEIRYRPADGGGSVFTVALPRRSMI
ncbi:MAG: ATP-binding protein [Patescibacteria group bacterium]|nr:MAG: ATP-binding protein [Patescibacteria group bacterium]